ncbi:MAG: hypothetical protein VYC39_07345 [Myxococcota bacterium]|nr:hypothetical protein [Myxococcota bacterium]
METRDSGGPFVKQSVGGDLVTNVAPSVANRRRSTLKPIDEQIAPSSDFTEEATHAGQDFPRLSTDAFIGERSVSDADEILLELTDLVSEPPPERVRTEPQLEALPKPISLERCINCGKNSDFRASIFCDHCGVRNPKRKRVGEPKDSGKVRASKRRATSKLVHRCKLCGYTVPSGSPACQNCGTPVL